MGLNLRDTILLYSSSWPSYKAVATVGATEARAQGEQHLYTQVPREEDSDKGGKPEASGPECPWASILLSWRPCLPQATSYMVSPGIFEN